VVLFFKKEPLALLRRVRRVGVRGIFQRGAALRQVLADAGGGVAGAEQRCRADQGGKGDGQTKRFGHEQTPVETSAREKFFAGNECFNNIEMSGDSFNQKTATLRL
jgi:hypothetical protein